MNGKKFPFWRIIILVVILTPVVYFSFFSPDKSNEQGALNRRNQPTPPIQSAIAKTLDIPHYLVALGTVTASDTVTVKSQVSGQLMSLHFKEGQYVNAGELLAKIDSRVFEVQLSQAKGQLMTAKANLENAKQDLSRYEGLYKSNQVSRQILDTQKAEVVKYEGSLLVAQAAVDNAKLQITYSEVVAPISGIVGLSRVDEGNMINANDANGIVVINKMQPIEVIFSVPEADISKIRQAQKRQALLSVELWDRNNQARLAEGALVSMDNMIDSTTGTIKLKATFTNEDQQLYPNQFVNTKIKVDTLKDAIVIPSTALQMGREGHFVWLVNEDSVVTKQLIKTGVEFEQQTVVLDGVKNGQRVVTDGLDRLKEGAKVKDVSPDLIKNSPEVTKNDKPQGEKPRGRKTNEEGKS